MTTQGVMKTCRDRWYPLIDHPKQLELITDPHRFKVVPAGRRSGKTERLKRYIAKQMMKNPGKPYFLAAPTRDQVRKIYWEDMKLLTFAKFFGYRCISESNLCITIPNGSSVTLVGLDKPERIEGVFWAGGGVDEIADVKEEAWPEHISPALDTFNPQDPDYRAWCWLIGVPDGLNHYYDLSQDAENPAKKDWKLYTWFSSDILPPDVIEAAKSRMSRKQYLQEYEASFETASGKIYSDYSKDNYTTSEIANHEQLLWMHDFNFTPMSSAIGVRRNENDLFILDEIVLESAVARQTALEFVDKFKAHGNKKLVLFGDPAGRAGEKHGHSSDYTEIETVLKQNGWTIERRVKNKAPAIRDRQNAVRAKIKNAKEHVSLFVNINKAPYSHKGLATLQAKKGSTFIEEETDYQHITTAIGYCVDWLWPCMRKQDFSHVQAVPTAHNWS